MVRKNFIYLAAMLYATASSLLIHNTGLPLAVLVSFCFCIGGLTIAWCLILCHKQWLRITLPLQKTQAFFGMKIVSQTKLRNQIKNDNE